MVGIVKTNREFIESKQKAQNKRQNEQQQLHKNHTHIKNIYILYISNRIHGLFTHFCTIFVGERTYHNFTLKIINGVERSGGWGDKRAQLVKLENS